MTGLVADLTAALERHHNRPLDATMEVPIGLVKAARTMLERYEGWPLVDRPLHPEFVDLATSPRRGGGKCASLCAAQTRRRERERMERGA
jgi:hypothetical protein